MKNKIIIKGARTHNLKNISMELPRNQLILISGVSGSGKSSLAFDTLYAEGQRRYVESLSTYARQFLDIQEKPDVDFISGLSPAIAIQQKASSHNPRSTVGTMTEIYDYLRLLFARIGIPKCPTHNEYLKSQSHAEILEAIRDSFDNKKIMLLAPIICDKKNVQKKLFIPFKATGYLRARINGTIYLLDELPSFKKSTSYTIEIVIDRLIVTDDKKQRISESLASALKIGEGTLQILLLDSPESTYIFTENYICTQCHFSVPTLEPSAFSFNSPTGACLTCEGLGIHQFFDPDKIIPDSQKSLYQGAIKSWEPDKYFFFSLLEAVANHYQFSVTTPIEKLPKDILNIILYGTNDEEIFLKNRNQYKTFEGVIANMERRYKTSKSSHSRRLLSTYLSESICNECLGSRLKPIYNTILINDCSIFDLCSKNITTLFEFFEKISLSKQEKQIAGKILDEIMSRLEFLIQVGVSYLTLSRKADTLSGGESQRIRLASQIGSALVGVLYVLDEPSIGLHQRDNEKLINMLCHLRDIGNTVVVVEHDEDALRAADYILDIGPNSGQYGGEIIAEGDLTQIMNNPLSITGQYLSGSKTIAIPKRKVIDNKQLITIHNATKNNLKNITCDIPLNVFTCLTGVSGSGKSSLTNYLKLRDSEFKQQRYQHSTHLIGLQHIDHIIDINQKPIGRTPRSNPATYTGIFTFIRELLASTPEAKARGYAAGRFSFNVKGGRCESCEGEGFIKISMHFLSDISVECDLCKGKRYNAETLEIQYKGKNIYDILNLSIKEALPFFENITSIHHRLTTLKKVGLDYLSLGQSATTLSGGEAQRVKLAKELSKTKSGKILYLLDEPTTGLHFKDIDQLLKIVYELRDQGNTILIIEHNLDVIKTCDWVIDLGPEGGEQGGNIMFEGTPEELINDTKSLTGIYLKKHLSNQGI